MYCRKHTALRTKGWQIIKRRVTEPGEVAGTWGEWRNLQTAPRRGGRNTHDTSAALEAAQERFCIEKNFKNSCFNSDLFFNFLSLTSNNHGNPRHFRGNRTGVNKVIPIISPSIFEVGTPSCGNRYFLDVIYSCAAFSVCIDGKSLTSSISIREVAIHCNILLFLSFYLSLIFFHLAQNVA